MTSTGSISLSGLLGGTAGQIDTTSLITQLMQAAALPQTQLQDKLSTVTSQLSAYQAINTKLTATQTAARALTDLTAWKATSATSSSSSVVATSDTSAAAGSTTFSVTQLARAQVSTVAAASDGTVVSDPSAGITITGADGTAHQISLTAGDATTVAAAINNAGVGVRASVITTDSGNVLQLSATKSGSANTFTTSGFDSAAQNVISAQDAKIQVGTPGAGGYTVTSSSNTFTNLIPGVTLSVSALATDVTVTVGSDSQSISNKVQALVNAMNTSLTELNGDSGQGAVLQGEYDVRSVVTALTGAVSSGTSTGASLKTYGIDMDSTGKLSFDPTAFATAYAADPSGTQQAIAGSFAKAVDTASTAAIDPTTGSITAAISSENATSTRLNSEISDWTTKLATIKDNLTAKYGAMETALAKLQSQQTYLTSMFKSMTSSSSDSSS